MTTRAVLIHSALSHGGHWRRTLAHLPGWEAVPVELPGHGTAPDHDPERDIGDEATERAAAALASGADVLVGHSFGGVVALRLALERPEAVGRLVLIEPVLFAAAAGTAEHDANAAAHAGLYARVRAGEREGAARDFTAVWGAGAPFDQLPPEARRYLADRIPLVAASDAFVGQDRSGLLAPGRLEALDLPVTLIEGAESPPVIARIMDRLEARLPRTARHRIAGSGHMVPITDPAGTARAMAEWPDRPAVSPGAPRGTTRRRPR